MKKLLVALTFITSVISSLWLGYAAGSLWFAVPLLLGAIALRYGFKENVLTLICAKISADIEGVDCDNPLTAGVNDRMIIVNFEDKDSESFNANPLIMEGLTLATGTVGYEYTGINNSHEPSHKLVKGDFSNSYEHSVHFRVFKIDGATKQQLEKLINGRVFVIIENNTKGAAGNSAFEVMGYDAGLVVAEESRENFNTATNGAFDLILRSSPKALEPHMPYTLYNTSYAVSKAAAESILV